MTPKEKAEKYVETFLYNKGNGVSGITKYQAIQCALICVDNKIEFIKSLQISDMMKHDLVNEQLLIINEIEKL